MVYSEGQSEVFRDDFARRVRANGGKIPPTPIIDAFVFLSTAALILVATFFGVRYLVHLAVSGWESLPHFFGPPLGAAFAAAAAIAAGLVLYLVRKYLQISYALMELATAAALATEASNKLSGPAARLAILLALLTATYMAVSGFGNLFDGLAERRKAHDDQGVKEGGNPTEPDAGVDGASGSL